MRMFVGVLAAACLCTGPAVQAQSYSAFGFKPPSELVVPSFSDEEIQSLLVTLDRFVAGATPAANDALWQFGRRIQTGRLSGSQESRVIDHLDRLAKTNPALKASIAGARRVVERLTVGKPAPEIAGTDLSGKGFTLSEYRGKVVALVFSAEWCAICRTQAPYERFLLGRYERWPFALLSVQTGSSREKAHAEFVADHVAHRSWWDVPADGADNGPIAQDWNVLGWPASYLIDGAGIIRFVNVRDEDLLKAVRQLVDEQVNLDDKARRNK